MKPQAVFVFIFSCYAVASAVPAAEPVAEAEADVLTERAIGSLCQQSVSLLRLGGADSR